MGGMEGRGRVIEPHVNSIMSERHFDMAEANAIALTVHYTTTSQQTEFMPASSTLDYVDGRPGTHLFILLSSSPIISPLARPHSSCRQNMSHRSKLGTACPSNYRY